MTADLAQFFIPVQLDHLDDDWAYFRVGEGGQCTLPRATLPADLTPGMTLMLTLATPEDFKKSKEELARAILNELLKTS